MRLPEVPLHGVGRYVFRGYNRKKHRSRSADWCGFIDLRKAFDTVNHKVLLNKLRGLGVLDGEHEWFRN